LVSFIINIFNPNEFGTKEFNDILTNYAAGPSVSLNGVVSSDHRVLIQFLSKDSPIPKSPNTVKKLLLQKACRIEENLKIEFESHKRFISATLDLWTDKAMLR